MMKRISFAGIAAIALMMLAAVRQQYQPDGGDDYVDDDGLRGPPTNGPLANARVEITAGANAGTFVLTYAAGAFRFNAVTAARSPCRRRRTASCCGGSRT